MSGLHVSTKRLQIDKASATIVAVVGVASFVTIFSLVSIKVLLSQRSYQSRIIHQKAIAKDQLDQNISAVNSLKTQYQAFDGQANNILGGSSGGKAEKDGDNARLILDALPSKYDFPALTSSLEQLVSAGKLSVQSITGTDDEVAQSTKSGSGTPVPIPMPFQISISNDYAASKRMVGMLDSWIRPVQIQTLSLSGSDKEMQTLITANTFYQPAKSLNITTKEVK